MKKTLSIFACLTFSFSIFASGAIKMATGASFANLLQQAQVAFDTRDYGMAVKYAEAAKERRIHDVDWSLYVLNNGLHSVEVRHVGDDIRNILPVIRERGDIDSLNVLNGKFIKIDFESVRYSASAFLKRLAQYKNFPEADFILGQVYVFSGEYGLAKKYLFSAWESVDLLDIAQQKTDILYTISDLARLEGNDDLYEKTLLLIVADDGFYTTTGEQGNFLKAIVGALKRGMTIDKFFELYRCNADRSIRAHLALSEFYKNSGERELALEQGAIGSLAVFTYVYDVLASRDDEFSYTGFEGFLSQISRYTDIVEWADENEIWKGFFTFSEILADCDAVECAKSILHDLALFCPENYWKTVSLKKLIEHI